MIGFFLGLSLGLLLLFLIAYRVCNEIYGKDNTGILTLKFIIGFIRGI